MKISSQQIEDIVIDVAHKVYGTEIFQRRPLMLAVEKEIRRIGGWTAEDEKSSTSVGEKSDGLAKIDGAISHLYQEGKLDRTGRNRWKLPQ
jgi:hypothetical protein